MTALMSGIEDEISSITTQINTLTTQISNMSSSSSSGSNGISSSVTSTTVGQSIADESYTQADMTQAKKNAVSNTVAQMRAMAQAWYTSDDATRQAMADKGLQMGQSLSAFGVDAYRDNNGVWWITSDSLNPSNIGKKLYECYHTGGFVGNEPLRNDEEYIKAKNGELILTSSQQDSIAAQIDRIEKISDALGNLIGNLFVGSNNLWPSGIASGAVSSINNITNNSQPNIQITETITCAPEQSVEAHQKISRNILNEIARQIRKP